MIVMSSLSRRVARMGQGGGGGHMQPLKMSMDDMHLPSYIIHVYVCRRAPPKRETAAPLPGVISLTERCEDEIGYVMDDRADSNHGQHADIGDVEVNARVRLHNAGSIGILVTRCRSPSVQPWQHLHTIQEPRGIVWAKRPCWNGELDRSGERRPQIDVVRWEW